MPGLVIASITSAHFTYFTKADDTLAASRSRLPAAINKESQAALPAEHFPHDALRLGLRTLKDENAVVHPLEATQKNMSKHRDDSKVAMMKDIYGTGLAARYQIEKQILSRAGGLPGRVPTNLGWEVLSGELDDLGPESYLGRPDDSVSLPPDFHSQMESQLKMKTKPMTRGVF